MKFKQQEENVKGNSILNSIVHLLCVNLEFNYAIKSQIDFSGDDKNEFCCYSSSLHREFDELIKLFVSINPEHKNPVLNPELKPVDSIGDLMKLEEKYYNMLKEIATNALEEKNIEVLAYLYDIIKYFKHYFCTLNEDNNSGETSS